MKRQVVIATGNRGKLAELIPLLAPLDLEPVAQSEFGLTGVAEDAPTFIENALAKAREAARVSGLPAIADDSGLEADALDGAPGVRSARYAGEHGNDAANNARLLAELERRPDSPRTANFRCVAVYLRHPDDPAPLVGEGVWHGEIARAPCGNAGFGYDPLFLLPDRGLTAAEIGPELKNKLSHRAQALSVLLRHLAKTGSCGSAVHSAR